MSITLYHNPHGQLCWRAPDGTEHRGLVPVRAFPIQAPQEGISLVGPDGKEVLWVAHLNELPPATRQVLEASLAEREFIPVIEHIDAVDSISTPSHWQVRTDRGPATLVLKGEEDIRRLSQIRLLIADANGIQFLVRDLSTLDKQSRKLLDRFL